MQNQKNTSDNNYLIKNLLITALIEKDIIIITINRYTKIYQEKIYIIYNKVLNRQKVRAKAT